METSPLLEETLVSFHDLHRSKDPTHPSINQLRSWHHNGQRAQNGQMIFLEALRMGATWRTSHEALARFYTRCNMEEVEGEAADELDEAEDE